MVAREQRKKKKDPSGGDVARGTNANKRRGVSEPDDLATPTPCGVALCPAAPRDGASASLVWVYATDQAHTDDRHTYTSPDTREAVYKVRVDIGATGRGGS